MVEVAQVIETKVPGRGLTVVTAAATGMARLRVPLPTIEKVLNHTSGSFAGIVAVYQLHDFANEKREALRCWGDHVERSFPENRRRYYRGGGGNGRRPQRSYRD